MALQKSIRQNDGVVTNYHRILFLDSVINHHISITVLSYTDKDSRNLEQEGGEPYKKAVTYEQSYKENMTIEEAYDYLKTLPEFAEATDI